MSSPSVRSPQAVPTCQHIDDRCSFSRIRVILSKRSALRTVVTFRLDAPVTVLEQTSEVSSIGLVHVTEPKISK